MKLKRFLIIALLFLVSCTPLYSEESRTTETSIPYELFYIEGMPCMRIGIQHSYAHNISWGVTCDWSKWNENN